MNQYVASRRHLSKPRHVFLAACGLVMSVALPALAAPRTDTVGLGSLGASSFSVSALNANGEVVGSYSDGVAHAFIWRDGVMTNLGSDRSGYDSSAAAINDSGQVVGSISNYANGFFPVSRAYVWRDGVLINLGADPSGMGDSSASAINASGQVAGRSDHFINGDYMGPRAVVWRDGVMTNLGTLGTDRSGFSGSWAAAINASGLVAGRSEYYVNGVSKGDRAFVWNNGVMTNLGTLGTNLSGVGRSQATALNARGQVVGTSQLYLNGINYGQRAFVWNNGVMTNLGTLGGGSSSSSSSQASAINASGQIVGSSTYDGNGVSQGIRAFIYNAGQMHRLDELAPAGWVWTAASGINDFGQVALNGTANGQIQSALFTPHPDWQGGSGHWSDASHWNYAGMGAFGFAPGAPHKVNIATTQATTVTGPASAAVQRLDISSTVAQGATLDMNGGELLTVEGTNLGHGAVLTGSGRLRGRVQSQPGSLLKLALGGIAAAPLNDKLVFEQSVTLGGDLEVLWRGGFAGSVGQVFDLFDWDGGVSGSFANLALPVLTGGLVWDTSDLYGGGSLKVMALTTAVPEPQTCALALAGLLVAATRVRLIRLSRSAHRPQAHPTPAPRGG